MSQQLSEVDAWMTEAQKWFLTGKLHSALQSICRRMYGSTRSFLFPAETRFAGKLLQMKRFLSMKDSLKELVRSERYQQYDFENDNFADRILGDDVWSFMERVVKFAAPILLLLRLGDSNRPTLSKLRGTLDYVRRLMVETGDGSIEDNIATAFHSRAKDFESDAANAAYVIDQQFICRSIKRRSSGRHEFFLESHSNDFRPHTG